MKRLILFFILFSTFGLHAQLLGEMGNEDNYFEAMVMSYQRPNTVTIEIAAEETAKTRSYLTYFYIPTSEYINIFSSSMDIDSLYGDVEYKAWGEQRERMIVFSVVTYDDNSDVAMKDIITINMEEKSIKIDLYRRKQMAFFVGKLKKVETILLKDLQIKEGINLYNDNRGDLIGTVVTPEGLLKATSRTTYSALKAACEINCN